METHRSRTAHRLMAAFSQLKRLHWHHHPVEGLKHSELFVLYCVKEKADSDAPGIRVSEISEMLNVTSPTITQVINSLESRGFVKRNIDPGDRRAIRIKLTDKGETFLHKASEDFFAAFYGLVEYLGESKSDELASLLSKTYTYFNEKRKSSL